MKKAVYEQAMKLYGELSKEELIHKIMALQNLECSDRAFANQVFAGTAAADINAIFEQYKDLKGKFTYAKAEKFYATLEEANNGWMYILTGLSEMNNPARVEIYENDLKREIEEAYTEDEMEGE